MIPLLLLLATLYTAGPQGPPRRCEAEPGRTAERITGDVRRGNPFESSTPGGWLVRLRPLETGWALEVTQRGREEEDLSPPRRGERATMESFRFSVCLTVPAKTVPVPQGR